METEEDDADNIFDLGEDDEEAGNVTAVPVAEVEDGDGVMSHDPYNPDDWDDTVGGAEAEEETSALLFDEENNGQEEGVDTGGSNDDDDLNSLMDRGLEEIDDLLSTKGRLSVFGPPQASSAGEILKTGNHRPLPTSPGRDRPDCGSSITAEEGLTAAESGDRQEQPNGDVGCSAPDFTQHPQQHRSARGTGANAASVLMSATAPEGSAGSVGVLSSPDPHATNRELGGSLSAVEISGDARGVPGNNQTLRESEEATRTKEGAQSYVYEAGAMHRGGDADHVYSPPRRREKEATPFIEAKGLTLTYAQAKLFGLTFSPHPAVGVKKSELKPNFTLPGSGSQPQTTDGARISGPGGCAGDGRNRHHQPIPRRNYSPSRMEQLSHPIPGRGRFGDSCIAAGKSADRQRQGEGGRGRDGVGGKAPFTWKRSRKAEAAMRDPACGYDFVREAGYSREDFLARTEAYSSYSRQKLETRRGEDHYAARVDKLECPQCHNPQSYDEFVSKKLKCGGCDVAYCVPRTWNRRVWEQRNDMCMAKSEERKARIKRETEEEFLRRMPKQTRHAALLRQRVGQVDFIRRMRRDLQRRRAREGGARIRHGNVEERHTNGQGKDAPSRPASAPTPTAGSRTKSMADRGSTSPNGKKRGDSEGRRQGGKRRQGG